MSRAVRPSPARQIPLQKLFLRRFTCSGLSLRTAGPCKNEQGCCMTCPHRTRKKQWLQQEWRFHRITEHRVTEKFGLGGILKTISFHPLPWARNLPQENARSRLPGADFQRVFTHLQTPLPKPAAQTAASVATMQIKTGWMVMELLPRADGQMFHLQSQQQQPKLFPVRQRERTDFLG